MKSRSEATQGSPNKFGWLAKGMLHRFKRHRGSLRDPANRVAFCASASPAAGQKFDCAQDDIQRGAFCYHPRTMTGRLVFSLPCVKGRRKRPAIANNCFGAEQPRGGGIVFFYFALKQSLTHLRWELPLHKGAFEAHDPLCLNPRAFARKAIALQMQQPSSALTGKQL